MTSAQVVETSVTNNSSFQNYTHPDDHTIRTIHCIVNLCRVLCGVILYLNLVGTIVDIAVSFAKSNASPHNANGEFMSIRGVTIATDQSIPDSERTSLLQSSAEVKECTNQQEPVLPSEYAIELSHQLLLVRRY